MKRILIPVFFLLLICVPLTAQVEDFYSSFSGFSDFFLDQNTGLTSFPILHIPIGGMFEGMGTAYTAVSLDSGFLQSNPAGSSMLDFSEVSLLHNNWIADSQIEGLVFTKRVNDFGIGIGGKFLFLPFTQYNAWGAREASGYPSESMVTLNASYRFFSSYYFYGLSLGMNIKAAYRHIPGVFVREDQNLTNQSAIAGMMDLGILTRFNFLKLYTSRSRNFSLGLVVKNLGVSGEDENLPTEATAGIAYSPLRPLLISVDINYPFSLTLPQDKWEGWNLAAGFNLSFTDFYSLQGGFNYRGANPRISLGSTVDLKNISFIVNYTLDLTTSLSSADRFSIQAKLNLGDEGRNSIQSRVDELYVLGIEAYAEGDTDLAIKYWENVLLLDSGFQPAREYINIAKQTQGLQDSLDQLNKVGGVSDSAASGDE